MLEISLAELRELISNVIMEGGLKLGVEKRVELTPSLVKQACSVYVDFIKKWNSWLALRGFAPVEAIAPSGSSTYAEKDAIENPKTTYGDVDYLVSFPIAYTSNDINQQRKDEATSEKLYTELMTKFLKEARPKNIDVESTLKGIALQVIVELPGGILVQVDTTVTHPKHTEWMKGRYTPERGIKGYVTGNLYKALGDFLTLSIGTEGVLARVKDGQRVSSKQRTGVRFERVSNDFKTFLADIAIYVGGQDIQFDKLLSKYSGMDPNNISIESLALGIVGLAKTFDVAGIYDKNDMLHQVLLNFNHGMEENVNKKATKNLDQSKESKLRQLNRQQYDRVKQIFKI